MECDSRGVIGCRDLVDEEVHLINDIRHMEAAWNAMIDRLRAMRGLDQRQISLAATHGEDAFMRAVRAVEQPVRLSVATGAVETLERAEAT